MPVLYYSICFMNHKNFTRREQKMEKIDDICGCGSSSSSSAYIFTTILTGNKLLSFCSSILQHYE